MNLLFGWLHCPLEQLPNAQKFDYAVNLLQDEVRAVRTEAARILSSVSDSFFFRFSVEKFDEVYEELKARYTSNLGSGGVSPFSGDFIGKSR